MYRLYRLLSMQWNEWKCGNRKRHSTNHNSHARYMQRDMTYSKETIQTQDGEQIEFKIDEFVHLEYP